MTYILFALPLALAGLAALFAVQAFRSEHLVAFSHRGGEFFLLERGADERYQLIAPVQAPAAVYRFARLRVAALARSAPHALRHVPGRPFQAFQRSERRARTAHA